MKNYKESIIKEINRMLEQISDAIQVDRSTFYLFNSENKVLESIVAQGFENRILSVPIGMGIVGKMFSTGLPIIENNVYANPNFEDSFDQRSGYTTCSTLCLPVYNDKNQLIGALQCLNKIQGNFTIKDQRILESFATAIALIIKGNDLYVASEKVQYNFSKLLEVFTSISSELELNALIPLIINKAAEITGADRSSFFLLDKETNELWTLFAKGLDNEVVRTRKGIVAKVAATGKPCIINDPYHHSDFDPSIDKQTGYRTTSIISVPVFDKYQQILGVVQAINKKEGVFSKDDLHILNGFASQIRIAIQNAELFDQAHSMKNYLNMLIQNLDYGIVTVDKLNRVRTVNHVFTSIFLTYNTTNVINKTVDNLISPFKELMSYGKETLQTGKKVYKNEIKVNIGNRKTLTLNISVLPMVDTKGEIIGVIHVFNDISKEKRIESNLSRYIPKHIVDEVMNKENLSLLKGNYSKCSILFSDIRNFTSLTEKFGAIQIVKLLNKYFEAMVSSIYRNKGMLDKFIGDAVMSVFGVPYAIENDAINSIHCALDMINTLEKVNHENPDLPVLNIGIGISTGKVVSGNIGSEKRFEYTVIGDPVNLAARLESATKEYELPLLICESTYQEVKHHFHCLEIDTIAVKGKQHPLKIYTVFKANTNPLYKKDQNFLDNFKSGLQAFQKGQFSLAKKLFEASQKHNPEFRPIQLFLQKCNLQLVREER
ncbi:GAF domain-containing protein [Aquimarina sp. ERC-38]|uniref:adenylate/guanylate cyclase domain-containing protein n=1 Tax=Aquimarina sp. ERC-38 TaxID=2949996 RepID=UPI002247F6C2|nr:adenylate/guanylate cyclase domain-containing protein [Aquimarina sp. ERC-38]UZO82167.1 GAF domain-containing protein [Aquimarina sp. ERC-38]